MGIHLEPIPCTLVNCDGCGEALKEPEYETTVHFLNESEAREHLNGYGFEEHDGKILCPSCIDEPNDNPTQRAV